MLRALTLLCAALSVAAAANPRQLAAVEHFLKHPPPAPHRAPPPVFVNSFSEPKQQRQQEEPLAPTPTPTPWFDCPAQFGLYPDPYKCSAYFTCTYGVAYEAECQPGLQFNPVALACDWPGNIDPPCQEIPYPPAGPPVEDHEVDHQEKTDAEHEKQDDLMASNPTPSPWFDCPTDFGLFPDPYKCSAYFQCSYGQPWEEECQPGLEYNPKAKACDYPGNIDPPCKEIPYPPGIAPMQVEDDEPDHLEQKPAAPINNVHTSATAKEPVPVAKAQLGVPQGPFIPMKRFARPNKPKTAAAMPKELKQHHTEQKLEPVLSAGDQAFPAGKPLIPLKRFAWPKKA